MAPEERPKTVYCIDAEDEFCSALEQKGVTIIRGSLGYRYDQALVRNLLHPPHECDVIIYNLSNPACYDAKSWGPGLNDNYRCKVVNLESDYNRFFHYEGDKRVYSDYHIVSETQIAVGGRRAGSFDATDVVKAVVQGGVPLVYFLNPTFLTLASTYLPLWLQMMVHVSATVANEVDLPNFSDRFPRSLSKIGKGVLDFRRPIKFRIDKVSGRDNASMIIRVNLLTNRVEDTFAALISYGKGYIFFLPPFQNDINGCVELVKDIIPRFQEEVKIAAERNRDKLMAVQIPEVDNKQSKQIINGQPRSERYFMELAIKEARRSKSEDGGPHPLVGAVVVKGGKVLAKAHRGERSAGQHAEFVALEKKLRKMRLAGATLYTTLEPCTTRNHPKVPCAQRITERKFARVVVGMLDPDKRITGQGERTLRKAGIAVARFDADLADAVEEINRDFTRAGDNTLSIPKPVESQPPVLELIYSENEWPFELNKTDNPNVTTVQIGLKNRSPKIVHNCYVRIERVESEEPSSLFNLFDKPRLAVPTPPKQVLSIRAGDLEYIPIAQIDRINFDLAGLGVELLCYSVEGHTNLDPGQKHVLTIKVSSEAGHPIGEKYSLWVDEADNLRFQSVL